jgi:hypothetical protein
LPQNATSAVCTVVLRGFSGLRQAESLARPLLLQNRDAQHGEATLMSIRYAWAKHGLPIIMLAAACGCATAASVAQTGSAVSAPPAVALSPFDGTYTGSSQRLSGDPGTCTEGGPVNLVVTAGRFHYPWKPLQTFDVRIAANGAFAANAGNITAQADKHMMLVPVMQGRVDGDRIAGEFGTRWCSYRYEATRN